MLGHFLSLAIWTFSLNFAICKPEISLTYKDAGKLNEWKACNML